MENLIIKGVASRGHSRLDREMQKIREFNAERNYIESLWGDKKIIQDMMHRKALEIAPEWVGLKKYNHDPRNGRH